MSRIPEEHSYGDDPDNRYGQVKFDERKRAVAESMSALFLQKPIIRDALFADGARILHICAGYGAATAALIELGIQDVTCVDRDPGIIDSHQKVAPNSPVYIEEISSFLSKNWEKFTVVIGLDASPNAIIDCLSWMNRGQSSLVNSIGIFSVWYYHPDYDEGPDESAIVLRSIRENNLALLARIKLRTGYTSHQVREMFVVEREKIPIHCRF